jgi:aspartate/methionine/tyrosine aminotransferase
VSRTRSSEYMEWAKLSSPARFNLAVSGLPDVPLADLPVGLDQLELTGPDHYGYPPLQQRLARRLGVMPECVVAATGTSMANFLALDALLDPGHEVLIESPTYELLVDVAEHIGARVRRFLRRAETGFAVEPAAIERALTPATRLIVITNLHNPSSALTDETTLREVQALARRVGARILVDEVYLETLYDLQPWRTSLHLGPEFVVTSSLTKAFGLSGLRCGYVLAEPELAQRMWRLNDLFGVNAAHPAERLSVVALDQLATLGARARDLLLANRRLLEAFLKSRPELFCKRPPFGTVVFPRLEGGGVDALVERLLGRYETKLVPGRFFGLADHFRLGVAAPSDQVVEGLARLGQALDERRIG